MTDLLSPAQHYIEATELLARWHDYTGHWQESPPPNALVIHSHALLASVRPEVYAAAVKEAEVKAT